MLHHSRRVCLEQIPREHTAFCRLFSYVPFVFLRTAIPVRRCPVVRRRFTRSTRFTRFTRYNVPRDSRGLDRTPEHCALSFLSFRFISHRRNDTTNDNGNDGDAQRSSPLSSPQKETDGRASGRTDGTSWPYANYALLSPGRYRARLPRWPETREITARMASNWFARIQGMK